MTATATSAEHWGSVRPELSEVRVALMLLVADDAAYFLPALATTALALDRLDSGFAAILSAAHRRNRRSGRCCMTEEDIAELREHLVAMRADLVERLAAKIDGGVMALLGSVGAAIAAVDGMRAEPGAKY